MNKKLTLIAIENYLKEHFIKYIKDYEDGTTERVTMAFTGYDETGATLLFKSNYKQKYIV
ncbi:MAG: hypothetical protein LUC50_07205 [Ruminococcus sp.]|nr:hypothetical protein [Ruminococcus sp.]